MSMSNRLDRLERDQPDADHAEHWARVHAERERGFNKFLSTIPDTHLEAVWAALGSPESVSDRLFARGPSWAGSDAPAAARFAWVRAVWGDDHSYNPPLPDPIPGALLDLYLDHSDAEIHSARCPGCRVFIPCSPHRGLPGVDYVPPHPLTDECPVCGAHVPPPRRC